MSMTGCQKRTPSHKLEFCTECFCSHRLLTFEPGPLYTKALLHIFTSCWRGDCRLSTKREKKPKEFAQYAWTQNQSWMTGFWAHAYFFGIPLNWMRIGYIPCFRLSSRRFSQVVGIATNITLCENIWMITKNLFTISSTLLCSLYFHQFLLM